MSGKMIVLYGINNIGKSTQAKLLVENLNKEGLEAVYLKFPLYDLLPSGKLLNDYLRYGNPNNLSVREMQIINVLNRTQAQDKIRTELEMDKIIISEDYTGGGLAWSIGGGLNKEFVLELNSHLIKEDLSIVFNGQRFDSGIESGHKHETDNSLTESVRLAYLELAMDFKWEIIDANQPVETIQQKIRDLIKNKLGI